MDLSIRQGETLAITITNEDLSADTAQLLVEDTNGNVVINVTENFTTSDGIRTVELRTEDTNFAVGDYSYMLVITYSDGVIEKLPNISECDDCDLPVLKICKAIVVPEVS